MEDFDKDKLDEIENVSLLVKKLATANDDPTVWEESEKYLAANKTRIKDINRSVINEKGESDTQEAFLEQIRQDAAERSERIAKSKEKADKIKSYANDYFKVGDYARSVQLYSEAIAVCKSYDVLYTNRAQAYFKMNQFNESLEDCEAALFLNPSNHKAYNLKAKSLTWLNRFDEAVQNYEKVVELKPNLRKWTSESIKETELLKKNALLQKEIKIDTNCDIASQEFENCHMSEIVKLLISEKRGNRYCIGGLQLMDLDLRGDKDSSKALYRDFLNCTGLFSPDSQVTVQLEAALSSLTQHFHNTTDSSDTASSDSLDLLGIWTSLVMTIVQPSIESQSDSKRELECVQIYQNKLVQSIIEFLCPSSRSLPNYPYCQTTKETKQSVLDPIVYQVFQLLHSLIKFSSTIGMKFLCDYHLPHLVNMTWSIVFYKKGTSETLGLSILNQFVEYTAFETYLRENDSRVNNLLFNIHKQFSNALSQTPSSTSLSFPNLDTILSIITKINKFQLVRRVIFQKADIIDLSITSIESRIVLKHDEKHMNLVVQLVELLCDLFVAHQATINGQSILSDCIKHMVVRMANLSDQLLSIKLGDPIKTKQMRTYLITFLSITLHRLTEEQLMKWCEKTPSSDQNTSVSSDNIFTSGSLVRSLSQQPLESPSETRFFSQVSETLQLALAIVLEAPEHPLLAPALKLLTLATKVSHPTRCLCCDKRSRVLKLARLVNKSSSAESEGYNEPVVGNVCLLLSQCIDETPVSEHLADYKDRTVNNIVMRLLRVCQDAKSATCRNNAAILAGKLGTSHHKHRAEISRLDGFSILKRFAPAN